jgi:ABC-type phosphate transport system substrate-binding protein
MTSKLSLFLSLTGGLAHGGPYAVVVSDNGNPNLADILLTELGNIYQCRYTDWSEIPGADAQGPIHVYGPAGTFISTDDFLRDIEGRDDQGNLVPFPPNTGEYYWGEYYPCVTSVHGVGAEVVIGAVVATDPNGIGFGDPAAVAEQGNHDMTIVDDR